MKILRAGYSMVILALTVVLVASYLPVQHECEVCNQDVYQQSCLEYVASGFADNFMHQECAGIR